MKQTLGEKQTETAAAAAMKLLGEDERTAVLAWIDDRERAARSTAATTATALEGARVLGLVLGAVVGLAFLMITAAWLWGRFDPPPPPGTVCPECPACAVPEALQWYGIAVRGGGVADQARYARTSSQECVSLGDTTLCAPLRVPPAQPANLATPTP